MKSLWHPGYEGTCYNGKQTADWWSIRSGGPGREIGVKKAGYSGREIKIRVLFHISFTLSVLGVSKIYFLLTISIRDDGLLVVRINKMITKKNMFCSDPILYGNQSGEFVCYCTWILGLFHCQDSSVLPYLSQNFYVQTRKIYARN